MGIQSHSRQMFNFRYIYAAYSRRSQGISLGVNLSPLKTCNFNCVYCEVNRLEPGKAPEIDLSILEAELKELLLSFRTGEIFERSYFQNLPSAKRQLKDIAFSGDGEPTLSQLFPDCVRIIIHQLQSLDLPKVKIVLITNATLLDQSWVQEGLKLLDAWPSEIWAKLDAGTNDYLQRIDRTNVRLEKILANIADLGQRRPVTIQSCFNKVRGIPITAEELAAYISRLQELINHGTRIHTVQAYTLSRHPAEEYVTPLTDSELDMIADRIQAATGLTVKRYYFTRT
jgi:wyosine [tRNA(Phe)-imidazoG37] synthetase (radical SAM superfamily)